MKKILVTGSNGFIGRNLIEGLKRQENIDIKKFDIGNDMKALNSYLAESDYILHLAGVNRPKKIEEFEIGNVILTNTITDRLEKLNKRTPIVFSSSVQAGLENPYGISKKKAEDILIGYSTRTKTKVYIYRLPNVFGKWCRPNYNSVVATFCYNISHGLDISISDPDKEIELVYIDDLVNEFIKLISDDSNDINKTNYKIERSFRIRLGELAEKIYQFRDIRKTLIVPDLSDDFMKCLYATYFSYLEKDDLSYKLELKSDHRGSLAELLKSNHFGQIFISKSHKGVFRGNHYHNTKVEKFCVIKGKAEIKLRHILEDESVTYCVSDENIEVVDIPPGYTHSIKNLSNDDLIVIFWANEIFNPQNPDTYLKKV